MRGIRDEPPPTHAHTHDATTKKNGLLFVLANHTTHTTRLLAEGEAERDVGARARVVREPVVRVHVVADELGGTAGTSWECLVTDW